MEKSDWEEAIDKLLDFVIEHYENQDNKDMLSQLIEVANPKNRDVIYAKINLVTKEIEFCDDNKLVEYYKK